MRVALLSMMEQAGASDGARRAFLRVGRAAIGRHQLGLVLALGCERVICLARSLDPELVALQHAAEQAGAKFHVVNGSRGLMGLISTADEVIALADGLLPVPEEAVALVEAGPGIAVQPAGAGIPAGFERIDAAMAAAGLMRVPGRLVERLAELPADFDTYSALQRIALQAGVPQRPLPAGLVEAGRWTLVRDEAQAHAIEGGWIRQLAASPDDTAPTAVLAGLLVRGVGPALLHAGTSENALVGAAGLLLLLTLGSAWLGHGALALGFCALAVLVRRIGGLLARVERASLSLPASRFPREAIFGWIVDAVIAVALCWSMWRFPGDPAWPRLFPALALLGFARIVPRLMDKRPAGWLADRAALALLLAVAAIGGVLTHAVQAFALGLAATGIVWPIGAARLTRA